MTDELDELVTDQTRSTTTNTSSSGSSSSKNYEKPDEMLVKYVLANLKAYDGSFHIPAHEGDDDAETLDEGVAEKLDKPEGTPITLEDLFDVEVDGEYVGTSNGLEAESSEVDRHVTIDVMKGINGYYSELVEEHFPGSSISVGTGSKTEFSDPEEQNTWVEIRATNTDKSERTRKRAELDVGELTETEYVEWCVENEMDPFSRKDNGMELEDYKEEYGLVEDDEESEGDDEEPDESEE